MDQARKSVRGLLLFDLGNHGLTGDDRGYECCLASGPCQPGAAMD